jgi:cell division protein FtsL
MKTAINLLILFIIIVLCALGVVYKESDKNIRKLEFERDSILIHNERSFA